MTVATTNRMKQTFFLAADDDGGEKYWVTVHDDGHSIRATTYDGLCNAVREYVETLKKEGE